MKQSNTKRMVESAILLALGFVLSIIKIKIIPNGGSITLASMLPIVILAYRYGPIWGMLCGGIHGLLQMAEGFYPPPVATFGNYVLVILLDYILAWAMVGLLSGLVMKFLSQPRKAIVAGSIVGIFGRFLCSFLSGIIIWGTYAPEGQSAIIYSFIQNGSVMALETVGTAVIGFALFSFSVIQNLMPSKKMAQSSDN